MISASPRFLQAIRDSKQLYYFADLWKSVLNARVDTQDDFKASLVSTNMDFDAIRDMARLAQHEGAYTLSQTSHNTSLDVRYSTSLPHPGAVFRFYMSPGRLLDSFKLRVDQSALGVESQLTATLCKGSMPRFALYNTSPYLSPDTSVLGWMQSYQMYSSTKAITANYSGTVQFDPGVTLSEGWYTIVIGGYIPSGGAGSVNLRYQNTDVLSTGSMDKLEFTAYLGTDNWATWTQDIGDPYIELTMSGYYSSGSFTTATMDLGKIPANTGFFQISADIPNGSALVTTLYGSTTGAFSGEETTYADVQDGWIAPAGIRYWRAKIDLYANGSADQTPLVDMVELYYPDDRIRFRQQHVKLNYVDDGILRDFEPYLVPGDFSTSELKPIDRVSSLGSFPISLQAPTLERIQKIISESPLKNFRATLYLGADVPGFSAADLFRICTGVIDEADPAPKYRGASYGLSMTIKNPMLDLKRKAPIQGQTALLDFEALAISEDGHALDAAIDIMRGHARIPSRYINISSFISGKLTAGGGSPAPEACVVRRSNSIASYSDGTDAPDTRIKSPTEVVKMLQPLMIIADGYLVIDESSRIAYVQHDTSGAYEETWADEALVKESVDAIPIQAVGSIKLGYADMLYNVAYCACEWDGNGDAWGKNFKKVYANVNEDSAEDFAPGLDTYYSVMEANMIEVSKWLGPESGYNGETLAQAITRRLTDRFSYPPVRLAGVALPVSQMVHGVGSVVRIWSREFAKLGRKGIAESETLRFMITKAQYDQGNNRMVFDLLELT